MKKLMVIFILALSFLIVGCSNQTISELELGRYFIVDSEIENSAWILLEENNHFEFNRAIATSYRPSGTYSINNEILVLFVSNNESYKFKIKDDKLIFISGDFIEDLIEVGTIFRLVKDN